MKLLQSGLTFIETGFETLRRKLQSSQVERRAMRSLKAMLESEVGVQQNGSGPLTSA